MRERLTFANVMSVVAVFIALGGGAYAVSLGKGDVKAKNIATNAVRSKHLKANTATGADIDESTLDTVPSADDANLLDSLDSTAFARGSGGRAFVDRIDFASDIANTDTPVFSRGGLELVARCQADPSPPHNGLLTFTAHTATDNATITNHWGQQTNASSLTSADEDFDTTDAFAFGPQNVGLAAGTIVYADTAGDQVTVAWQGSHDAAALGGTKQCLFSGTATTVLAP
jgi:hypothetical protein